MTRRKLKTGDRFWSGVSVFVPGNFVAVHVAKLSHLKNYEIVNKDAFLQKFFNITRMPMLTPQGVVHNSPFAMPEIEIKRGYDELLKNAEFQFEVVDANKVRMLLDEVKVPVTTYVVKKI
jgi:hypothetical protein